MADDTAFIGQKQSLVIEKLTAVHRQLNRINTVMPPLMRTFLSWFGGVIALIVIVIGIGLTVGGEVIGVPAYIDLDEPISIFLSGLGLQGDAASLIAVFR